MDLDGSPSHELVGKAFTGEKARLSWRVTEKVSVPKGGTGGMFSVGYVAANHAGDEYFLKATDVGLLRIDDGKSKFDRLRDALNIQGFEREMLDICTTTGMDRIVRAVDYGELEVVHHGVKELVFYIVFEKATGDIRAAARTYRQTGISWIPRVIHNLAVAASQLHRKDISHNDIKPSNFLVFDATLQKLSDLGRATCENHQGPWDNLREAGDQNYSAPEAWGYLYHPPMTGRRISHEYRKKFDVYMLGSLMFFLLTEQSLNTVMSTYLRPEYGPSSWSGDFEGILPYLRDVHGHAMTVMESQVETTYGQDCLKCLAEILQAVKHLTDVDPQVRGDPRNSAKGLKRHDLQRLISRTDILTKKFAILEKS